MLIVLLTSLLLIGATGCRTTGGTGDGGAPAATASPGATSSPSGTTPGTTAPAPLARPVTETGDAALDAGLLEVARFVEATRGHPFKTPVRVQLVDDAEFERRYLAGLETETEAIRRQQHLLEALEVIPRGTDLVDLSRRTSAEGVLGFYDPATKELLVRGGTLTPWHREIAAHELTHALDDQWFDIERSGQFAGNDDAAFAFSAAVEGSAELVREAFVASLSDADRAQRDAESDAFGAQMTTDMAIPPDLAEALESAYTLGAIFAARQHIRGGNDAVDESLRHPPVSSEQVLHPELYDQGHVPRLPDVPPADATAIDQGVFGELGLIEVLDLVLAPARSREAAAGWAGDRYVAWTDAQGRSCIRMDLASDSTSASQELESSVQAWARHHGDAQVDRTAPDTLRLRACA